MTAEEIEKINQLVSRTDMTGNEKVSAFVEFAEAYSKHENAELKAKLKDIKDLANAEGHAKILLLLIDRKLNKH